MNEKKCFLSTIKFVIYLHLLGLLFLSAFRVIQYFALRDMVTQADASVLSAFVRGVWFDNVIGCYILIVPLVVLMLSALFGFYHKTMRKAVCVWFGVFYVIAFAISASNIPYFQYFFKNINSGIFGWFGYAGTTAGMIFGEKSYLLYIASFLCLSALFLWALRRIYVASADLSSVKEPFVNHKCFSLLGKPLVGVALIGLCLFGIRGRTGYNPIKVSEAYYCNDPFLNQLGISPTFNLLTSSLDAMRSENKELRLMPYGEAITNARRYLGICGRVDSAHVLRRYVKSVPVAGQKRNVVVILMESMSANLLQTFGQRECLTPVLDSLYHTSLAFTNCYSAGIHTNHGLTASLYSFPALMNRNLMKGTITPKRSGIPTVLKHNGYHNMFFMTHEAQYDNMNAFFRTNGYDDVYSQENYPSSEVVNSFGVSDHFLFKYAIPKINAVAKQGKPFMATLLTVSNHPPYVIPPYFHPHSNSDETRVVEYADWAIGQFIAEAKQQPWYDNTVFVVLADHGKIVGKVDAELPQSYNHIPLLIWGAGITPQVNDGLATQVDVMPTLLSALGLSYEYDGFGVNLLNEKRDMVFYSADNQIVARDAKGCYIYYPDTHQTICYDVLPDWQLHKSADATRFNPLRQYVFSMVQTAEHLYRMNLAN